MDSIIKLLLVATALGLWTNVAVHIVGPARADDDDAHIRRIEKIIETIANGTCSNHKICSESKDPG